MEEGNELVEFLCCLAGYLFGMIVMLGIVSIVAGCWFLFRMVS